MQQRVWCLLHAVTTTAYRCFTVYTGYGPNSTWLDLTRLDTFDFVEPCFSNMADDEEAVVLMRVQV